MSKKRKSIPVNTMADDSSAGIAIERISFDGLHHSDNASLTDSEKDNQSHRHDSHSFFLLEKGTISIEIDFQKYKIKPSSVIYIHPDQVHLTTSLEKITVSSWSIANENLNPEYLKLLEDITPAKPLPLKEETFTLLSEAVSLALKFSKRKSDKLYHSLLKDNCNALVALVISLYLERDQSTDQRSRFGIITKDFRQLVERNFTTIKRPAEYARKLNLSTAYLNECVKNITGHSVSYHIQQRIMLEAKRLLYHSDRSVKEIAAELGYDDYPYFSRLFTKVSGMTAVAFRKKNLA